jgi:hypothetical protein
MVPQVRQLAAEGAHQQVLCMHGDIIDERKGSHPLVMHAEQCPVDSRSPHGVAQHRMGCKLLQCSTHVSGKASRCFRGCLISLFFFFLVMMMMITFNG